MTSDLFKATDRAVRRADSRDPFVVAGFLSIPISDLILDIVGMTSLFGHQAVIGINVHLSPVWRGFVCWHELAHILLHHVGSCPLADREVFSEELDSRSISRIEREANLVSAEYCISTDEVLDLMGYATPTLTALRTMRRNLKELSQSYEQLRFSVSGTPASGAVTRRMRLLRQKLRETQDQISALESDLMDMQSCRSLAELAQALECPERVLRYKLAAMKLRGYDLETLELEGYDSMFDHVL